MGSKKRHKQGRPASQLPGSAQQIISQLNAFYSGPLPQAAELQRYEQVKSGFAERIMQMAERQIAMAESQIAHRQDLEKHVIRTNVRLSYLGLLSGFILCAGGLAAAVYLIDQGRELGGGAAFVGSLAALAGLFIYGRKKQEQQLTDRLKKSP
jgi:uncharacterized membrane protein